VRVRHAKPAEAVADDWHVVVKGRTDLGASPERFRVAGAEFRSRYLTV
jgi:hypothetical protein